MKRLLFTALFFLLLISGCATNAPGPTLNVNTPLGASRQIQDKRALCVGISYALMEARYDVAEAADFHARPGTYAWSVDRSTGLVIADTKYWLPARSVLDGEVIVGFAVRQRVVNHTPMEALLPDAEWAGAGKLSHLYISCHGFEVELPKENGKGKKIIRGLYLGYDPDKKIGYAYSFDYLAKNLFKYFNVIFIDACYAGGAKHPERYVVPGSAVVIDGEAYESGVDVKIKSFTLSPSECNKQWVESDPTDPDKNQTIIVATRQGKPAFGSILGGAGRSYMYNTEYRSLFTASFFTIARKHLMSAYGYKNLRKVSSIVQDTNEQMDGIKLNWQGAGTPNCSVSGPGNRLLFEE